MCSPQREAAEGYEWWYLDVEAPDGLTLVAIVFDGFPFHPAHLRDPALQVEIYRHGRRALSVMSVGESAGVGGRLTMSEGFLRLDVDAWAPFPGLPVKGSVTITGELDGASMPGWALIVRRGEGRIDLDLGSTKLSATGFGYADHNWGDRPFHSSHPPWVWARHHGETTTTVVYRDPQVRLEGRQRPTAFGIALPRRIVTGDLRLELGRPCLTAPFYARLPTRPRGLAEIGRPRAITVPGLRHLVAMRLASDGILHRAERRFLRRPSPA